MTIPEKATQLSAHGKWPSSQYWAASIGQIQKRSATMQEKVILAYWGRRWECLVYGGYLHLQVFTVDETNKSERLIKATLRSPAFLGAQPIDLRGYSAGSTYGK